MADAAAAAAIDASIDLCVQYDVQGSGGAVQYWIRGSRGRVAIASGTAERADVTITTDAETAWRLHDAALDAQEAFRAGHLRLRGNITRLVAASDALGTLTDVFAQVRSRTVRGLDS